MKKYLSLNIKYLREKNGISQSDFAINIGKKRAVVGSYERGEAEPSLDILINIAENFGISIEELISKDLSSYENKSNANFIGIDQKILNKSLNFVPKSANESANSVKESDNIIDSPSTETPSISALQATIASLEYTNGLQVRLIDAQDSIIALLEYQVSELQKKCHIAGTLP